jgi:hypothetical protein
MTDKVYCKCDPQKPGAYGRVERNDKDKDQFVCDEYKGQCTARWKCGATQCETTLEKTKDTYESPEKCADACMSYECDNGTCTPTYKATGLRASIDDCLGFCGKYACIKGEGCKPSATGDRLPDCEKKCNKFRCLDKNKKQCVAVFYEENKLQTDFDTKNCDGKCEPDPRYKCENGTCVKADNGYLDKCPDDKDGCALWWGGTPGSPVCTQNAKVLIESEGKTPYPESGNCMQAMKYSCKDGRCVIDPNGKELSQCYEGCKPPRTGINLLWVLVVFGLVALIVYGFSISGKK